MTVTLYINAIVKEDKYDDFAAFLEENLPNTRAANGCRKVSVFVAEDKQKVILEEEWLSEVDHQNYIDIITSNGVMEKLRSFLEADPLMGYYRKTVL